MNRTITLLKWPWALCVMSSSSLISLTRWDAILKTRDCAITRCTETNTRCYSNRPYLVHVQVKSRPRSCRITTATTELSSAVTRVQQVSLPYAPTPIARRWASRCVLYGRLPSNGTEEICHAHPPIPLSFLPSQDTSASTSVHHLTPAKRITFQATNC